MIDSFIFVFVDAATEIEIELILTSHKFDRLNANAIVSSVLFDMCQKEREGRRVGRHRHI
jgi:hypothetical protein